MWQERDRAAKFFGVTLNPTKSFPINTMHLQTFLDVLSTHPAATPSVVEKAIETCFAAIWHTDSPVATREDLETIFKNAGHLGLNPTVIAEVLDKSMQKDARTKLQEEAKALVENEQLFGMPSMVVERASDGQRVTWFGSDRFEQLAAWLDVPYKGPFADGTVAKL